jgi:iron complex outermembrane receptor protein
LRTHRPGSKTSLLLSLAVLACLRAGAAGANESSLADLSLQALSDLPVTSVSKTAEPLSEAPAAIYVITSDDIRRSGVRTLVGALRLAPNLEVAEANNQNWAIGARGATQTSTDKFLVLIDGRIVYSPLFSGTFWDAQNVMLEDIDRIEVVSGPGGVLWGTNAVNGVINIITRKAETTSGTLAAVGAGRHGGNGEARYGGDLGDAGSYRVYGMLSDDHHSDSDTGQAIADGQNLAQAGFRSDWNNLDSQYTLQGDAYKRDEDNPLPGDGVRISGMNLMSHWVKELAGGSDLSVLAYYDHTLREQPLNYNDREDIGDVELQQALPQIHAQTLTWGASYRFVADDFENMPTGGLNFEPPKVNQNWESLFAQNESALSPTWRGIVGLRYERNPYTGGELLPNLRLAWDATQNTLLWAAVSRAVRSPSRLDVDLYSPQQAPFFLVGNPNFQSEVVRVYEAGLRSQPSERWSYSLNVYHNYSDNIRTTNLVSVTPLQVDFGNSMTYNATGVNAWGTYKPLDNWRIQLGFAALRESYGLMPGALPSSVASEANDPSNQWMLRSSYDFSDDIELDVALRHVGALPNPVVPAYTSTSIRVGYNLTPRLELSIIGSNLTGPPHVEFGPVGTAELGRTYYARLTWRP